MTAFAIQVKADCLLVTNTLKFSDQRVLLNRELIDNQATAEIELRSILKRSKQSANELGIEV